jgi:hypothetical protein
MTSKKASKMPPPPQINPLSCCMIRFIDGNKLNCRADNLAWCNRKQIDEHPDWVTDYDLHEYRFFRFIDGDTSNRAARNLRWCNRLEIDENPDWVTQSCSAKPPKPEQKQKDV